MQRSLPASTTIVIDANPFYLALSTELNVDFGSADRYLVNAARQAGIARAHWIGEN